jgi:peptidoglycan/LPS O-acetylase OafA/YrhL
MKFKERSKEEKVQRIDHLTGLRFFAALLVFLSHVNFSGEYAPLHLVFKQGYIGVSFFFVLSGFVLSYSYKSRILEKSISKTKYLILRYVRIYPLHWLVSLPVILSSIGDKFLTPSITFANLSLFQSWMPAIMFYYSFNAPSWSLSNEMFFYFCFMGLVFLSPNAIRVLTLSLGLIIFYLQQLLLMIISRNIFY